VLLNMERESSDAGRLLAETHDVPYLGAVPFDEGLEGATGDAEALARSAAGSVLARAFT
jgi:hypothetical protein